MKFPFPLAVPAGRHLTVTQQFKSKEMADFYAAKGLTMREHNGVDVVCGNDVATFGAAIVCPFPYADLIEYRFEDSVSAANTYTRIKHESHDGHVYEMAAVHISGIEFTEPYSEGDAIAYVGNSGTVSPAPEIGRPFAGAHLHLTAYIDGKLVDPLTLFDIAAPFTSPDTGTEKDIPAIKWAISQAQIRLTELLKARGK